MAMATVQVQKDE